MPVYSVSLHHTLATAAFSLQELLDESHMSAFFSLIVGALPAFVAVFFLLQCRGHSMFTKRLAAFR